jgi:hypothetical protein
MDFKHILAATADLSHYSGESALDGKIASSLATDDIHKLAKIGIYLRMRANDHASPPSPQELNYLNSHELSEITQLENHEIINLAGVMIYSLKTYEDALAFIQKKF